MMIARPRGMRRVPSLRSTIHRTTGARMYATSAANTNGRSTRRPRYATNTTNTGKPQRRSTRRTGPPGPNRSLPGAAIGPVWV
jgi:hypothetical protein